MTVMINVAEQYSSYPSGRTPKDGTHNGETFREEFLRPALSEVLAERDPYLRKLIVNLDGVRTFGSSFLEEAFGGMIRCGYTSRAELESVLELVCTKPHLQIYRDAIPAYIADAERKLQKS